MNKINTTIELNGRQYDARTGALLSGSTPAAANNVSNLGSLDGVRKKSKPQATALQPALKAIKQIKKPVSSLKSVGSQRMDIVRAAAPAAVAHHPEPTKTLMRRAVHKPSVPALAPPQSTKLPSTTKLAVKQSVQKLDKTRLARAQAITQSADIKRFGVIAPSQSPLHAPTAQPVLTKSAPAPSTAQSAISSTSNLTGSKPSMDIFERAIERASNYQALPLLPESKARKHRGVIGIASAVLAVVVIGGFLVYKNVPNVSLYMASAKAGFSASLPSSTPSGFSVGKMSYGSGTVAVNYDSNSDRRAFQLIEKPSSWDSATLRDSYVQTQLSGQQYQTFQSAGRTIYVYGNGTATWVNGGIWYIVQSNGSLSPKQLVNLASTI